MTKPMLSFTPLEGVQLARRLAHKASHPEYPGYDYDDDLIIAVNAALATERPLLLRGLPGCGKSTVALDIALALDRDYLPEVITSKTTATDLEWRFDAVGRLGDNTANDRKKRNDYVHRGVLWKAFEESARGAVVLLDEIDKADPDVPNDLLVPLGEGRFEVTDLEPPQTIERKRSVLVVVTTNGERELPPAFLRRCVALTLDDPSANPARLARIAKLHIAGLPPDAREAFDDARLTAIVARVDELTRRLAGTRRPGTAEILDAIKASLLLQIIPGSTHWSTLTRTLLYKDSGNPEAPPTKAGSK